MPWRVTSVALKVPYSNRGIAIILLRITPSTLPKIRHRQISLAIQACVSHKLAEIFALSRRKKPPEIQGLEDGAGEEGRTPDLMLGKHTL